MELKDIKNKAKWPHQQLVQVEFVVDVKGGPKKGEKKWVGNQLAQTLIDQKRVKKLA